MKSSADARKVSQGPRRDRKSRRNVVVMASLLASLVFTSVLLLAMRPSPLPPDVRSLFAIQVAGEPDELARIYDTPAPLRAGRWSTVYIHHSKTRRGSADSFADGAGLMSDHFLIGNGNGHPDGAIQIGRRWDAQLAAKPAGISVADNCISICLVGDFDSRPPTAMQLQRLEELTRSLQQRCGIPAGRVLAYGRPGAAGIGSRFPTERFAARLLR